MGLSWGKLEEILNSKKSLRPSGEEAAHPTNVLLQIILPIVLILGVVVFTKIQVLDRLIEEVSRRPFYELYDEAYLELQKQILIRVLERIKSEEREYLGIDLLSGKIEEASNKFVSNRLVDGDFKGICKRTYDRLRQRSRKEEVNHLYDAVLKTTHEELKRVEREKKLSFREITQGNKEFAKKQIEEFINGLIEEIATLQVKTIEKIHLYFEDNLEELHKWNPMLIGLRKDYANAKSEEKKKMYSQQIHKSLHKKLETDLKKQGCYFLEETWEKKRLKI